MTHRFAIDDGPLQSMAELEPFFEFTRQRTSNRCPLTGRDEKQLHDAPHFTPIDMMEANLFRGLVVPT